MVRETVDNVGKPVIKRVIRKTVKEAEPEPVTKLNPDSDDELETPNVFVTPGGSRKRRDVSPETVDAEFTELCSVIELEIERLRELKDKNNGRQPGGGIKVLRTILKRTKQLQNDVRRVARKKRAFRQGINNSGFSKPTLITDTMADFLGIERGSYISRVDCTKGLHKYIIDHNLQNPENRREIMPNRELTKLLQYDKRPVDENGTGGHGPLYYYTIQKLIQQHFIKETPSETPADS